MFKRGDVVKDKQHDKIGVVAKTTGLYHDINWFIGGHGTTYHLADELSLIENQAAYVFEASLALGDTAKVLELYRAEQARTAAWQKHFQPLFDQYGAEQMAWIAGSIVGLVATGQFDPASAIRHWSMPQAAVRDEEF